MKRGFSLIELLVVVAIVAILVGVATPYYSDYVKESKRTKALQDLDVLKQAVVLYNSQEDLPYQGQVATSTTIFTPILGENDFNGLQGRYLTYIPVDPWGKNYKLDPYGCFVYSQGADSRTENDDIRDYYVKDLAMTKIEWEDVDNDRTMNNGDYLHFNFNKAVFIAGGIADVDFDIYENNEATTSVSLGLTWGPNSPAYSITNASTTTLVCTINGGNLELGVHALAFKDDLAVLRKYQEVNYNRRLAPGVFETEVKVNAGLPVRYAVRTNPIKITPK